MASDFWLKFDPVRLMKRSGAFSYPPPIPEEQFRFSRVREEAISRKLRIIQRKFGSAMKDAAFHEASDLLAAYIAVAPLDRDNIQAGRMYSSLSQTNQLDPEREKTIAFAYLCRISASDTVARKMAKFIIEHEMTEDLERFIDENYRSDALQRRAAHFKCVEEQLIKALQR